MPVGFTLPPANVLPGGPVPPPSLPPAPPAGVPPVPPVAAPAPAPGLRYVLGPSFNAESVSAPQGPPPPAPTKQDVSVTLGPIDATAWTVSIDIPAYDPATFNQLAEIRVYLAPEGSTLPADANGWVASSFPVSVEDVSSYTQGVTDLAPLPAVPAGKYLGQVVLGFKV